MLLLLQHFMKNQNNVTPGHGLLEKFLSKKRAKMANHLIQKHSAHNRILDIGCGVIPLFLMSTNFNEKFGIDPHINYQHPENKTNKLNLLKFDVENNQVLPFEDNFFFFVNMVFRFSKIIKKKKKKKQK